MRRLRNIALVVLFLAVLLAPTVASLVHVDPFGAIDEKRELAKKPAVALWSADGMRRLPVVAQAWEKYFNDNFGLRKLLIGSYRLGLFHLLGVSSNPAVVAGRSDGDRRWLYFDATVTGDGIGLESLQGRRPYTLQQLGAIAGQLQQVTAAVRASGATLVIAVAPDKQTVYPEYLPASQRPKPGSVSRLDQFWVMAKALPDVPLVDLRAPLLPVRSSEQLYYPSDTHWNLRAGFLAYQAIAHAIAAQDPTRISAPIPSVEWQLAPRRAGDLTILMGLPTVGGDLDWVPAAGSLPAARPKHGKLLLIADSFFDLIAPFLEPEFEQVSRQYVTRGTRQAILKPGLLEKEKPDVVILESVERYWTMD
jgi:alginate O-acetyltransferase complex protein AlgJ